MLTRYIYLLIFTNHIKNCELFPKTYENDHKIISAAYSEEGQKFAIKNCDILFTFFSNFKKSKLEIKIIKKKNKKVKIYTTIHVVCKKTNKEAKNYYDYYSKKHHKNGYILFVIQTININILQL